MLRQRVLTALVLVIAIAAALIWMPAHYFWYLLALVLGLVVWEWTQFAGFRKPPVRIAAGVGVAVLVGTVVSRTDDRVALAVSAAAVVGWLASLLWLRRRGFCSTERPGARLFRFLVGLAVVLSCATALGHLFEGRHGRAWFVVLLAVIAAADTGAYFAGRRFGRRKLAPAVSPGKTWEGVMGGLLVVALVAALAGALLGLSTGAAAGLVMVGIATAAVSILGDLLASLMKRQSGLKDSSRLLPGHGGVIDRFDSLMAASPIFYLGVSWIEF